MKISRKSFLEMKSKYDKEVRSGKPGKERKKDIDHQTDWVFFDRAYLQEILDKTDEKTGGIKFYLTEYTEETAKETHPEDPEKYIGRLTLVLCPTNLGGDKEIGDDEEDYYNSGELCPPTCPRP
ncbi:hypothetical protein [Algoriphagus vanfongensis]|uniref:hypothetical protein n=1 Tax=Algoriphagus vanfongensis TaxID=426371 RepID=UPI00041387A1|nr:hypothetical protein [Algoriphagus vanfongensis]